MLPLNATRTFAFSGPLKWILGACLLVASVSAFAEQGSARVRADDAALSVGTGTHVLTSHGLLVRLQGYMREQGVDANDLTADGAVRLMIDWFRFAPIDPAGRASPADTLVFRYGGWSEGCATAFKLSLLRRVTDKYAGDGETDLLAGITLMFEPSGQAELLPFTTASSDWQSIDAFLEAVESTPAFRELGAAKPMSAMVESGGLR